MATLDRVRTALMFALLVAGAQAACLLLLTAAGLGPGPEDTPSAGTRHRGPGVQFWSFVGLLVVPMLMHNRFEGHRWAPVTSRQAAVVWSLIGLALGFFLGALLAEKAFPSYWTLASRVGAVLGSFLAVFLSNLDLT